MKASILLFTAILLTACSSIPQHPLIQHGGPLYPLESPQVSLGMPMSEVAKTWGEPARVQSAGQPELGNQRWVYPESSAYIKPKARVIYFERGRVAGWETVSAH